MLRNYRVYGLQFRTDFALTSPLGTGTSKADFSISTANSPSSHDFSDAPSVYVSPYRLKTGEPASLLYRIGDADVLRFPRVADFHLYDDRILIYRASPADREAVELHLLGDVLSFWLEKQGIPALHSAGLVGDKLAFAFAADTGGGKSTLAVTMMRAGFSLLADDIVAVEERRDAFYARPGYPQVRLWPEEVQHFLGSSDRWPQVRSSGSKRRVPIGPAGIGDFCDSPAPLACIYLPDRRDGADLLEIAPVSPRDGFMALVRNSFTPRLVEAAGLQRQRLRLFTRLARTVPIRRLSYPSGKKQLHRVRDALLEDLDRLGINASQSISS